MNSVIIGDEFEKAGTLSYDGRSVALGCVARLQWRPGSDEKAGVVSATPEGRRK